MKFAPFRSATAAKVFATHHATQVPNFFMSTPQFNRQRSQVALYSSDSAKTYGIDPGALGTPTYALPNIQQADDDDKERYRVLRLEVPREETEALPSQPEATTVQAASEPPSEDIIAQLGDMLEEGQYVQVLERLAQLEQEQEHLPLRAYIIALSSLAELSLKSLDAVPLLEAYNSLISTSPLSVIQEAEQIVVRCLLKISARVEQRRRELQVLLGPSGSELSCVDEALASVDPTDSLKVALSIVLASSSEFEDLEQLVLKCAEYNLDCGPLKMAAGVAFGAPRPENPTELEHKAFVTSALRAGNADAVLEFDDEYTTLKLAEHGYVSTAARRACTPQLLEVVCSQNVLSTASLLFDRLAATHGLATSCAGRCAYLRLCVRSGDDDMLLKAIKESHLARAVWDPVTILDVGSYLISRHTQLAVELFVAQTRRLDAVWRQNDMQTLVGQDLTSTFLERLRANGGEISVFCALLLCQSPLVYATPSVRQAVMPIVLDARVQGHQDYVELMSEQPEALAQILEQLSRFIGAAESKVGLALPFDVQYLLHKAFPLLVSDMMDNFVVAINPDTITRALELLKLQTRPWQEYASQQFGPSLDAAEDDKILAYLNAANGIDVALDLFERQILLRNVPGGPVVRRFVEVLSAGDAASLARFNKFRSLCIDRMASLDTARLVTYLRAFVRSQDAAFARECYERLCQLDASPCAAGYAALILQSQTPLALFEDAMAHNQCTLQVYDATLQRLSNAADVKRLFEEMTEFSEVSFRSALTAFLAADMEAEALAVMERMFQHRTGYEKTTEPYNMLLEYYVYQKKDRKAALKVFAYTRTAGVVLSPHSYRLLIETWLLQPMDLVRAEHVLETMQRDEAVPNTLHFSSLLRARGILDRDVEGARALYRGLVKNSRVQPDQHIFAALIMSYVANGKSSELPAVLDEMKKYRVQREKVEREIQGYLPV